MIRGYFIHLKANWKVAGKSLVLFLFHFFHGLIPRKLTEHEFWGIGDTVEGEEE
jgi:hypothetical protein